MLSIFFAFLRDGGAVMDYEFLNNFQPKIEYVLNRNEVFWEKKQYAIERESTSSHVFAYVYDGQGKIEVDGRRYVLQSGALFNIAAGSSMKIVTDQTSQLKFYSVRFLYGHIRWEGETVQWTQPDAPLLDKAVTYFDESPKLYEMFRELHKVWNDKGIGFEWKARLQFQLLLDAVIQMIYHSSEHKQHNAFVIEQTIEYIRNHLHERLDRRMLAERASLSHGYFTTLFKQFTGCSLIEFVTRLRMERAKMLLRETSLPIYKISEMVGYSDSFYFTRIFTKETGMSPREFRRS